MFHSATISDALGIGTELAKIFKKVDENSSDAIFSFAAAFVLAGRLPNSSKFFSWNSSDVII
ncbi:hypothetical protein D3C71_2247600 [compost metagenome]